MSGTLQNRSAVFTSAPQTVEIYQGGCWWPGFLLGWRHDLEGQCQVWVRTVVGGVEETAWTRLDFLRLPQSSTRAAGPAAEPLSELTATMNLFSSSGRSRNDGSGDWAVPRAPGRRRRLSEPAPSLPATDSPAHAERGSSRPPAPSRQQPPVPPRPVSADLDAPRAAGRHRAPAAAEAGRHRAADTGMLAVVDTRSWHAANEQQQPPQLREAEPAPALAPVTNSSSESADQFFTRPMRLGDAGARPGRGGWDAR